MFGKSFMSMTSDLFDQASKQMSEVAATAGQMTGISDDVVPKSNVNNTQNGSSNNKVNGAQVQPSKIQQNTANNAQNARYKQQPQQNQLNQQQPTVPTPSSTVTSFGSKPSFQNQ